MKQILMKYLFSAVLVGMTLVENCSISADEWKNDSSWFQELAVNSEIHGFWEVRGGMRTGRDPHERDISVAEARLQGELFTCTEWFEFKCKGDVWADDVTEAFESDLRELWLFTRPLSFMDIKIGRQVLTWGTGELVFVNDLFPKDWQSYFIGRDAEYLKAPSDAAKISLFSEFASIDLVYTPQFDADRYITGKYVSHWSEDADGLTGCDNISPADKPDKCFRDDELSLRIYKNINNYELAVYGYFGFWKGPGGQEISGKSIFPALNVYGWSLRGQMGSGIGNLEMAWYQSRDDKDGENSMIKNSEMRYLAGYTRDIGKDFNAGLQYYVEQMLNYDEYRENLTSGLPRDHWRHVITLVLSKKLMNQNLELSLSGYYSPSDADCYLRPHALYKYSDDLSLEAGINFFSGADQHTFFGQFENNTNVYSAVRYSF